MADGTNHLGQVIEVVETLVVAGEGRHILGPWCKDKQRAIGTGLKAAALGFPILANRVGLHMNQPKLLFQCHVLDSLLTLRHARSDQHISAIGCGYQPLALCLPVFSILCGYAIGIAVEEHLVLLRLTEEEHITEGTIARATNSDTQGALKQIGIFTPHHVAERIIAEVAFPIIQLAVAHEDVVVIIGFEERRPGLCS